jgi:hypothetical protein
LFMSLYMCLHPFYSILPHPLPSNPFHFPLLVVLTSVLIFVVISWLALFFSFFGSHKILLYFSFVIFFLSFWFQLVGTTIFFCFRKIGFFPNV